MEISHWIWYTDSVGNTAVAVTVQGGNGIRKDYRDGGAGYESGNQCLL